MLMIWPQQGVTGDSRTEGGMIAWPREDMRKALDIFVPARMQALNVPGVSIVIVENGKTVYLHGFGFANQRREMPVTPDTLFQAGELGEVVTAYAAMTMVRDKLLFLDAPLSRDLNAQWLDEKEDAARITLRHILTHTSGLPENTVYPSREARFAPGSRFSPSGVGFLYLQHVMETVEGKPFEQVMRERVLSVLGMQRSTFLAKQESAVPVARGYVPLGFPLALFFIPAASVFLIGMLVTFLVLRFAGERRILGPMDAILPAIAGGVTAIAFIWIVLGLAAMLLCLLIALLYFLFAGLVAAFFFFAGSLLGIGLPREGVLLRGRSSGRGSLLIGSVLLSFFLSFFFMGRNLPVPALPFGEQPTPNAAVSFRTSARDMARFLPELMQGKELGAGMFARLMNETIPVDEGRSTGLVLVIRHDKDSKTLWSRGAVTGFDSLLVIDPQRQVGVVVLTNARQGAELTQEIARNILGTSGAWTQP